MGVSRRIAAVAMAAWCGCVGACATPVSRPELRRSEAVAPARGWGVAGGEGTEVAGEARAARRAFDPRGAVMLDGSTGAVVSWEELLNLAAGSDAVLIGEVHGHEAGLSVAAALFDDLLPRSSAVLSMEFFERDQQMALDDYLTGVTDEEGFRRATGRTAGNYPAGHRAMVESAKRWGRPVVAANAPRRYTRLARTDGFERLGSLAESQRGAFALPGDLTGGGYRERFYEVMSPMMRHSSHGGEAAAELSDEEVRARVEPFYRAQNVWDATMAESVDRAMRGLGRPVVHMVGQFHTDFEGGLVTRLKELSPSARVLTISLVAADAPEGGVQRAEDAGRAGVVVYAGE